MRRNLSVFMLVLMTARAFLPCVLGQAMRSPHAHVVIGNVTSEELEEHERGQSTEAADVKPFMLKSGIILSIPFGDESSFLAQFFLVALTLLYFLYVAYFAEPYNLVFHQPPVLVTRVPVPPPRAI